MAVLTPAGSKVAVPSFLTCGGEIGPLFECAKRITQTALPPEGMDIWEFVPEDATNQTREAIRKLEEVAVDGKINPISFLVRFGSTDHTRDMSTALNLSAASVAREIPPEFRPLAHTMLPIKNGVYANDGVILPIRNLVPIGPQTGNLVAHLAGSFSVNCSEKEIEKILWEQASDEVFMKMADSLKELDYKNYPLLRTSTQNAVERLGLK